QDLAHSLPALTMTRRQLTKGGFDLDFGANRHFSAAGLTGTVESTVRVHVAARQPAKHFAEPPDRTTERLRDLEVEYDVTAVLARGTVPLRAFRKRRVVVHLKRGIPFALDGWSGSTSADLTVTLIRKRTHVRTFKV